MFLRGDEIIFSNVVRTLCQAYSNRRANLICSVQYLEENPEGDVAISGIEGRRYFHRVDEQFKTLNAPYLFASDDPRQKLMLTSTRVFNPLLGTKFFERNFLTQNAIRFNENLKAGSELLFLTNAVMASKEIIFLPNLFYVSPK